VKADVHLWIVSVALLFCSTPSFAEDGPGGAPATWPPSITANVGDLQVRFESRSFWTLYRIDFKGERLCLDRFGSHYGSVAKFSGVGFIGSGHTENEDEEVISVRLFADEKALDPPPDTLTCTSLRFEKESRIRALHLETVVEVGENRIIEEVRLRADEATPVDLVYHFMHPWTPDMTHYLGELLDGARVEGEFNDDKGMEIDAPTRWSAVYDTKRGMGAVTYVLDAPPDHWRTRYWDVPKVYRKHYFMTFFKHTIPADQTFRYRIVTMPFAADNATWKKEAARVAGTASPKVTSG
jgi:hypothetical protein